MHVTFSAPVPSDFFDELPGIKHITRIKEHRFALSIEDAELVAKALVSRCATTNTTLLEMTTQQNHLEQLFFDITCNNYTPDND